MTDDNLSDLREQSRTGSRLDEDADPDAATVEATILRMLAEIDDGDRRKTMSIRDGTMAALLAALDEHPEDRQRVGDALARALGRAPADEYDRSHLLRLLVRVGLRETVPDVYDTLGDAQAEHAKRSL